MPYFIKIMIKLKDKKNIQISIYYERINIYWNLYFSYFLNLILILLQWVISYSKVIFISANINKISPFTYDPQTCVITWSHKQHLTHPTVEIYARPIKSNDVEFCSMINAPQLLLLAVNESSQIWLSIQYVSRVKCLPTPHNLASQFRGDIFMGNAKLTKIDL